MGKPRPPKYSLHKSSGQARVYINGRSIYLGAYGSAESRHRYDQLVAEWHTNGPSVPFPTLTVAQLCIAYVKFARTYYVKQGRVTSELSAIQMALRPLVRLYGGCMVSDFGPRKLKQVRDLMIENGIVRKSINRGIGRIKRMFKWGVENELVGAHVYHAINAVAGLSYGRSAAQESDPIERVG